MTTINIPVWIFVFGIIFSIIGICVILFACIAIIALVLNQAHFDRMYREQDIYECPDKLEGKENE